MPLKQFSSALVLAALLAGCSSNGDSPSTEGASVATGSASAPAATPAADGRCDANAVQAYVGKQADRQELRRDQCEGANRNGQDATPGARLFRVFVGGIECAGCHEKTGLSKE